MWAKTQTSSARRSSAGFPRESRVSANAVHCFSSMLGTMTKQVAIDARVSTGEQTPDNQLQEVRAVAERMDWHIIAEHVDQGISGARGRDRRPG